MNRKELEPSASPKAAYGERLRRLRDERGWTQDELGTRTGYSGTHISAVETGRRSPTPRFSRVTDRALGTGDLFEREGHAVRNTGLLEGFTEWVPHEMAASELRLFEIGIISGLLQTPAYAAALQAGNVKRGAITEEQAQERLEKLAERQNALRRTPPPFVHAVLDESCLRRRVGSAEIMDEQLGALLEFAELPNSVLQIAPYDLGERRSFDLPITFATLPDRSQIAYAESAARGQLVRETTFVHGTLTHYHQLQAEALSQVASVAMIEGLRKGTP